MRLATLVEYARNRLRTFRRSERGNVMLTFALATVPLVGFVGAAVDYSRFNSDRAAMQAAIDSTGLMLSKDAQKMTSEQLTKKAGEVFATLFHRPDVMNVVVTPVFTTPTASSFKLKIDVTGQVPTTFTKIIGQEQMDLFVSTEVVWGVKKLELALALDVTGSMDSNNKMEEMKKAAKSLLTTLKVAAKKDGDIKVAIIPFNVDVNVGTSNVNANWIEWEDWDSRNGTCSIPENTTKRRCERDEGTWTPADHSSWNGCVTDREKDFDHYDTNNTPPNPSIDATKFAAQQFSSCPASLVPLTYNWTALDDKITALSPKGNTNVTIGLAWGFHALTAAAPLNTAAVPADDLDKVIILLTDGDNTQNRWSSDQSSIDARTTRACANVKAAGIKLYTIRVIDGNASLLRSCATKPDMYYNVQNASQLNGVFTEIAQSLANLRIAK